MADREVAGVTRAELAELMVGRPIPRPRLKPRAPGTAVLVLKGLSAARGLLALRDVDLEIRQGEVGGIAGVAGNGQSLLADVISGMQQPSHGTLELNGTTLHTVAPAPLVAGGVARIPEDRHAEGLIGDMTITENVVSETYRSPALSRHGLIDWRKARTRAKEIIMPMR